MTGPDTQPIELPDDVIADDEQEINDLRPLVQAAYEDPE